VKDEQWVYWMEAFSDQAVLEADPNVEEHLGDPDERPKADVRSSMKSQFG
jgi:hypothetical protein